MMKRLLAMLLAALLLFTCACAEETAEATETAEPGTAEAVDVVMVTVNGRDIMASTVVSAAEYLANYYNNYYSNYGTFSAEDEMIREYAVLMSIQNELLTQYGEANGLNELTDEEIAEITASNAAEWEEMVAYYMSYFGATDESTEEETASARELCLEFLAGYGYTEESSLSSALESAIYNKTYEHIVAAAAVSDEEVEAAFNEQVSSDEASYEGNVMYYEYYTQYYGYDSYYQPAGYRGVTQILLSVDEDLLNTYLTLSEQLENQEEQASETNENAEESATATDLVTAEDVEAARQAVLASVQEQIDEIKTRFAAGEAFADLIPDYNIDPGMNQEPYRSEGYSVHADSIMYDPAFIEAAFSVNNIGEMSEPYVGSYGIYIVYYLRDVPAGPVELTEEIREELRTQLESDAESELFSAAMEQMMNDAEIVYTEYGDEYRGATNAETTEENAEASAEETTTETAPEAEAPAEETETTAEAAE